MHFKRRKTSSRLQTHVFRPVRFQPPYHRVWEILGKPFFFSELWSQSVKKSFSKCLFKELLFTRNKWKQKSFLFFFNLSIVRQSKLFLFIFANRVMVYQLLRAFFFLTFFFLFRIWFQSSPKLSEGFLGFHTNWQHEKT